ncbi:MAG: hypothetical protein ACM3ZF_06415 [Mycobacterium leprae]
MTECLLDRPAAQAWPSTREWITEFLRSGEDHWDREAAIAMTSEALFSALTHADRPVRMAARRDGTAAQVSVYAHTSTLPKTEWTAGSPLVEELLPRLRQRTRHCGAEVKITLDGAQMVIWFTLPRKTRGIGRRFTKS